MADKLKVKISNSIIDIDKKEWDSVFPPIVESYNFFKTSDSALRNQFKPYYISIYEDDGIICSAPCFIMDYPLETTLEGPLKKIASILRKLMPRLFTLRVMVCGCTSSEGRIGIKYPERSNIIEALVKEMERIAKKEGAKFIAFKDFSEEYATALTPLKKMGFHKITSYPSVELDIRFKTFEDYLSSLSRMTRKDLKRKFKKLQDIKIEMEVVNEAGGLIDSIYKLYLYNLKGSEVQFEILTKEFFSDISKNMPKKTRYFQWRHNGKLTAFNLCLVSKDVLVDEYIGMDPAFAYKYHLYYVTFRDIITWCIQNGIRTYESGALGYDPKKRLDLKFISQYIYVKNVNRLINFFFGMVCLVLKPENFDPVLKSLKDTHEKK